MMYSKLYNKEKGGGQFKGTVIREVWCKVSAMDRLKFCTTGIQYQQDHMYFRYFALLLSGQTFQKEFFTKTLFCFPSKSQDSGILC